MSINKNTSNPLQLLKNNNLINSKILNHLTKIYKNIEEISPESIGLETLVGEDYNHNRLYFETKIDTTPPNFVTCHHEEQSLCGELPEILSDFYEEWNIQGSFLNRQLKTVGFRMHYNDLDDYIMNDLFFRASSEYNNFAGDLECIDLLSFYRNIYQLITKKDLPIEAIKQLKDFFSYLVRLEGQFIKMKIIDLCENRISRFYFKVPNWDSLFEILSFGHWSGDFEFLRSLEELYGNVFPDFLYELEVRNTFQSEIGIRAILPKDIDEKKEVLRGFLKNLKRCPYLKPENKENITNYINTLFTETPEFQHILKKLDFIKFHNFFKTKILVYLFFNVLD
ncbi:MAG: hypothetical protein ACEPOW_01235 [Bacteroidales bacterium]